MTLSASALKDILKNITPGYKSPDDEFFEPANKALKIEYKKLGVIRNDFETTSEETSSTNNAVVIDCNVPGCLVTFENVFDYQSHYNTQHRFLCSICKRVLPTPHLLDLHISETHDSFFQASVERAKKPMYACYLEDCKQLMSTPAERKEHCIQTHNFPANFRFDKIRGNDKKHQNEQINKMEVDTPETTNAAKKIKAFTFGHTKDRCFNKKCTKREGATLENLNDLMEALEE